MAPREPTLYLVDIVEAARAIRAFLSDRSAEEFGADELVASAVHSKLIIIGEAAANVPADVRDEVGGVDWPAESRSGLVEKAAQRTCRPPAVLGRDDGRARVRAREGGTGLDLGQGHSPGGPQRARGPRARRAQLIDESRGRSADHGDRQADRPSGGEQCTVTGDNDKILRCNPHGSSQVHSVVRPERLGLSEIAGLPHEIVVEVDELELSQEPVEFAYRSPKVGTRDPARARSLREAGSPFDGRQTNTDKPECLVPGVAGGLRAGLIDQQGNDRRGIEVGNQRRCSAMRSDTVPGVFSGFGRLRLRCLAGVTRPSRINRSIVRSPLIGRTRAIARPRSVMTTSSPACTRARN